MKYSQFQTKNDKVNIYPFVCWHLGVSQSDENFIKEMIYRVKHDQFGKWGYLGDAGECVVKASKGDIYEQKLSPDEQLDHFIALTKPIKDKCIFAVSGNHGRRIYRETGMDWDKQLAGKLGVQYSGIQTLMNLRVKKSRYDVLIHHGIPSGVSTTSKVNAAKKLPGLADSDVTLSAHSHVCMALDPVTKATLDTHSSGIKWRQTFEYICGSAYDSRTGYAEEKGYPPILPAHLGVTFYGSEQHNELTGIWRAKP